MIIKIKCDNDKLLDILYKNPNTDFGLYCKSLKNGQVIGNAVNKHLYEVIFQDSQFSYMPEDANQADYLSYCSPIVVLHICNELFAHMLKSKDEYANKAITWLNTTQGATDSVPCTIEVASFFIDSNWYKNGKFLLCKYFEGIQIEQQSARIFKLTIHGTTVFEAFNLLALVSLFTHITNTIGVYTYIDNCLAEKYGRILTNLDNVPYFVFYLFNKRAIHSEKQFQLLKPTFEKYLSEYGLNANLVFLDNYQQRIAYITDLLSTERAILDIGCGEFTYYKKMMNKSFQANYYAIDQDPTFEQLGNNIAKRFVADNLFFMTSLDEFASDEKVDIILTEVIEHNKIEDALTLLDKALKLNFNQLIITTPNADFNQFYNMTESFRHDDHCFELSQQEFEEWIEDCILDIDEAHQYAISFFQLGDQLNGVRPTQGCVIKKQNN